MQCKLGFTRENGSKAVKMASGQDVYEPFNNIKYDKDEGKTADRVKGTVGPAFVPEYKVIVVSIS